MRSASGDTSTSLSVGIFSPSSVSNSVSVETAMVLDRTGAQALLRTRPQVQALVAGRDGHLWQTPGMAARPQPTT